jgi:hypothetical protein
MCFDVEEYAEFAETRTVKTRKPHQCDACAAVIPVGASAQVYSGLYDGEFFRTYECEECQRLTLSIAAHEIERGCGWHRAWCPMEDLLYVVKDYGDQLKVLQGTISECRKYVNELWERTKEQRKQGVN